MFTEDGREVQAGSGEVGLLAVGAASGIPLGYYKDDAKTAATFKVIDGVRYSIPGDWAKVEADGSITLLGRGSVCINTGGEKVFPEEVEEAIKLHPAVEDCTVVGVPDEDWGEVIVAVVAVSSGAACRRRGRSSPPPAPAWPPSRPPSMSSSSSASCAARPAKPTIAGRRTRRAKRSGVDPALRAASPASAVIARLGDDSGAESSPGPNPPCTSAGEPPRRRQHELHARARLFHVAGSVRSACSLCGQALR